LEALPNVEACSADPVRFISTDALTDSQQALEFKALGCGLEKLGFENYAWHDN
jgi:hypothetical protein